MFQRILIPVDLSNRHDSALKAAVELARSNQGEIILLHVIELITGLNIEEERPFYDRLEKVAREHLKELGAKLQRMDIPWRMEIRLGARVQQITAFANESNADLILLTSPRPDPSNPLVGWGSLSYRVAHLAACPVLLVR